MLRKSIFGKLSAIFAVIMFSFTVFAQAQTNSEQKAMHTDQKTLKSEKNPKLESSAQQITDNLAAKIVLRDEQKEEIKDAIYEYQATAIGLTNNSNAGKDNSDSEAGNTKMDNNKQNSQTMNDKKNMDQWLNNEIESILDDTQKSQWQVAKADFWNQLSDQVSTLRSEKSKKGMF